MYGGSRKASNHMPPELSLGLLAAKIQNKILLRNAMEASCISFYPFNGKKQASPPIKWELKHFNFSLLHPPPRMCSRKESPRAYAAHPPHIRFGHLAWLLLHWGGGPCWTI